MTGSHVRRVLACSAGLIPAMLAVALVWPQPEANAIPAFSRRYHTACSTCHVAYPVLTPFGDAYRRNGYRFPGGEDEDAVYEEPVPLGHDAHRRVFPDAIWPSELPSMPPIAAVLSAQTTWLDEQGDFELSFAQAGSSLGLIYASPVGEVFSAWAGFRVTAGEEDGQAVFEPELERVFMVIKPFDDPVLNFRVGRIEPGLMGVTIHRTLGPAPWILTTPVGDNGFTVDPAQLGLEATGAPGGRFNYSLGIIDGSGNFSSAGDDFYARVGYKFGGMRLDGIGGAADPLPWRDDSVQIGAFGLMGRETIGVPEVATQDDDFTIVGGDLTVIWWDLSLTAAYAYSRHDQPLLAQPGEAVESHQVFTQLMWVAYPWLIPLARYEARDVGDAAFESRIVPALYFLIRQNIRAQLLGELTASDGDVSFDQLTAGAVFAF